MIEVVPYEPLHLHLLLAQGVQPHFVGRISIVPGVSDRLHHLGPALTALDGGQVLAIGGMLPMGPQYGHLWAALSASAGLHMLALDRATRRFLSTLNLRRLEATVEKGFEPGCRWLKMLGFHYEGQMRGYGENGETHLRFGLVRR